MNYSLYSYVKRRIRCHLTTASWNEWKNSERSIFPGVESLVFCRIFINPTFVRNETFLFCQAPASWRWEIPRIFWHFARLYETDLLSWEKLPKSKGFRDASEKSLIDCIAIQSYSLKRPRISLILGASVKKLVNVAQFREVSENSRNLSHLSCKRKTLRESLVSYQRRIYKRTTKNLDFHCRKKLNVRNILIRFNRLLVNGNKLGFNSMSVPHPPQSIFVISMTERQRF